MNEMTNQEVKNTIINNLNLIISMTGNSLEETTINLLRTILLEVSKNDNHKSAVAKCLKALSISFSNDSSLIKSFYMPIY